MTKYKIIILLTSIMMAGLTSCSQEKWKEKEEALDTSAVSFGAYTWTHNFKTTDTRTEYSGELIGTTTKYERINWLPGYDRVCIASPQAATADNSHYHDYAIESLPETNQAGSRTSRAGLSATDGGRGLHWGNDNIHRFYAMYPALTSVGNDGSTVSEEEFGMTLNQDGATITGTIPASQSYASSQNGVFAPDMTHAPMWAWAVGQKSEMTRIFLSFEPLFTAYELTLLAGDELAEDLILKKVRLSSAVNSLSGGFTADISTTGNLTLSNEYTGALNYAEVTINEADRAKLSPSSVIKVTLFTLPADQTKLTLDLTFECAGIESHRKVDLKKDENNDGVYSDSEWLTMEACKKVYIRNINVPGELLFYDMDPVAPITVPAAMALQHTTQHFLVNTEADPEDGYQGIDRTKATPWVAYFLPGDAEQPAKDTPYTDVENISPTPTENWFTIVDGDSGLGHDDPFRYKVKTLQTETIDWNASPEASDMRNIMRANNKGVVDLSTVNILTGEIEQDTETANCYVIDGYGTFLIPLVYGNGYMNGVNTTSYIAPTMQEIEEHATRGLFESGLDRYVIPRFHNAFGREITTPYILPDTQSVMEALGSMKTYTVADLEGRVVWQDVKNGSEIITDPDIEVVFAPTGAAIPNCAYLRITIPQERIKPGNAVVSVVGKKDEKMNDTYTIDGAETATDKTLWSWHLWFRANRNNQRLTTKRILSTDAITSPNILSEDLGWTPPISYSSSTSPQATQRIVFVSTVTGRVLSSTTVTRESVTEPTFTGVAYSNTYYNWGRKDPFLPGNGDNTNKPWTSDHYDITPAGSTTAVHSFSSSGSGINIEVLGRISDGTGFTKEMAALRTPIDYGYFSSFPWLANSAEALSSNAWNNVRQTYDDITRALGGGFNSGYPLQMESIKTVYDPTPRGFVVPEVRSFTGYGNISSLETNSIPCTNSNIYGVWKTAGSIPGYSRYPAGYLFTNANANEPSTYMIWHPAAGERRVGNNGADINLESIIGASWLDTNGNYKFAKTRFLVEYTYTYQLYFSENRVYLLSDTDGNHLNKLLPVRPMKQYLKSETIGQSGTQTTTNTNLSGWTEN